MGFSRTYEEVATLESKLAMLKSHPNYKEPYPMEGETKTRFILRAIGELISPKQEHGEDYEIECVTIRDALYVMDTELDKIWKKFKKSK